MRRSHRPLVSSRLLFWLSALSTTLIASSRALRAWLKARRAVALMAKTAKTAPARLQTLHTGRYFRHNRRPSKKAANCPIRSIRPAFDLIGRGDVAPVSQPFEREQCRGGRASRLAQGGGLGRCVSRSRPGARHQGRRALGAGPQRGCFALRGGAVPGLARLAQLLLVPEGVQPRPAAQQAPVRRC